ncbi:sensor histidine kinase [Roseivirga sp. E12]|uniref:sensor histidine kinase n=1 Tax=Roseivirga sp. E12 TaxID=2819237 RepID=UPI001ABC95DE|nr:histidine kinase dimerization/phosphoacceptor domain -containing protein [Roseivirga sp. E12]MBO3696886.1 hypothetical protein [Roseivirga sp. E12]
MNIAHCFLAVTLVAGFNFQQKNTPLPVIPEPEKVLSELETQLTSTSPNSQRAFALYSEAAQLLAKRGNYEEANSLFEKSNTLTKYEPDSVIIIEMNLSRANMNKEEGKYTVALQTYLEALTFYQKRRNANAQLWVYSYIIELYRATYNADLALKYIEESEALMANNEVEMRPKAYLLHAKASYFLQFQIDIIDTPYDTTRYHLDNALKLAEEVGDSYLIGLNQNGLSYLLMHNDPSASDQIIRYLDSAKGHMLTNERFRNYTSVLQTLALHYTRSGKPELAVDITFEAIDLSIKNNWTSNLGDLYRLAGEVYYELGQYKKSAEYLNEALGATKKSMAEIHSMELGELTTSNEKALAERKLLEQQTETELAQRRVARNRQALIATAIFSVIILAVAIVSAVLYFRLKRANTSLKTQQGITRKTNAKLKEVVGQKNVLYKELNHRVKNNLTVLSSLIYLQEDGEQNETQKELYQTLRHRIQSMALIHQNLYEFDQGLNVDFQQYLKQLIPEIAAAFGDEKNVTTNINCDSLEVNIDEAIPMAMIINELITNSFKYAFKEIDQGKISLASEVSTDKRIIHYRDNGPGIQDDLEHDQPQRLGMLLIRLMVDQLKGKLTYEGGSNGVYFRIELP